MAQARITADSRDRLVRLAEQTGQSQQEVIDAALRRYEEDLFLDQINEGYAALQNDPDAWKQHVAEIEEWDATLSDGIA